MRKTAHFLLDEHGAGGAGATRVYRRRRPERTALNRLVQPHLETWLAVGRDANPADGSAVATHVERELRAYLECGVLACDCARAYCDTCGHVFLVAFSRKGRGTGPSCTTRLMRTLTDVDHGSRSPSHAAQCAVDIGTRQHGEREKGMGIPSQPRRSWSERIR